MGDYRNTVNGAGTLGYIPTGGFATGNLEYVGDRDVFVFHLISGLTYTIEQLGSWTNNGTLVDPWVWVLTPSGSEVGSDDDRGVGLNALTQFWTTAPTQDYFVQAASFGDDYTGTYRVQVSEGVGSAGNDTITGTAFADAINGALGNDTINGGGGNDTLRGEFGNDILLGGAGNDQIYAGEDFDTVRGQAGNDVLRGGLQADILIGGLGNDVFDFDLATFSTPASRDVLRAGDGAAAFQGAGASAGDRIDLAGIDANTAAAGNQAFVFGGAGIGRLSLVNSGTDTVVRGNTDTDATLEFEFLIEDGAVLASAYRAADFIL
jgi:Ca2+-binding RTX toxin-like protein